MTLRELSRAIRVILGSACVPSFDESEGELLIVISVPWWAYPWWWIKRNAVLALVREHRPVGLRWELQTKLRHF